ncbi:hypothetical protein DPMN_108012 [Dreissena polymorpha]|uniref:Uncharacterized protein n=1 Tax=Dreissena polymorpha TaxID=45954 RepID=A0A9D4K842_DREPO|nr:hypothetical protein DPMN_108012 [Dreissena polymorpha]
MNNKWPHGGNVFQQTRTIFELVQDIIGTNLLTKFHEDPTINVASTVFTRQIFMTHNRRRTIDKSIRKYVQKTAPPPGGHVFSPIWPIFELVRDINTINVLTKFHDDWEKIVTSRVFTRNTAQPPSGHLFEDWASYVTSTVFTSFNLSRGINGKNVLTKFHEDQTINVASGVFTRQMLTTDNRQKAITKAHHELVVLRGKPEYPLKTPPVQYGDQQPNSHASESRD